MVPPVLQAVALVWYVPAEKGTVSAFNYDAVITSLLAPGSIVTALVCYCHGWFVLGRETADGSSSLTLCAEAEGAAALVKALAPYVGRSKSESLQSRRTRKTR